MASNVMTRRIADTLLFFAPEQWGEVERFSKLCSGTYTFDVRAQRALAGVRQHFDKALVFSGLAANLESGLQQDKVELDSQGFTPALRSLQVAAVVEAAIVELYSCIDCVAKVLRAIYDGRTRGFKASTRFLFENIDAIMGDLPEALRQPIRGARWYKRLRFLRDELTHLATGACHLPHTGDKAQYIHLGVTEGGKPLVIDDVFSWLNEQFQAVNLFLGEVFSFLRTTLTSQPVHQMCGMVQGRMLMRIVDPTQPLDFGTGMCMSWMWFEKPDAPTCPFAAHCGAYSRTRGSP